MIIIKGKSEELETDNVKKDEIKKESETNYRISVYALKEFVKNELVSANIEEAEEKALLFVMDFLDFELKQEYIIKKNEDISNILKDKKAEFFLKLEKLKKNTPLEYVINKKYIYSSEFYVKEGVLIPRSDTEVLIEEVLNEILKKVKQDIKESKVISLKILDLCAGTGVIGISVIKGILDYLNSIHYNSYIDINIMFLDISDKALEILKKNLENILFNKSEYSRYNLEDKIIVLKSDLLTEVKKAKENINIEYIFDYILSNPPYIKTKDIDNLSSDVKEHEPKLALDGGESGLDFYERILKEAVEFVNGDSNIFFEIGYNQADDIQELVKNINSNINSNKEIDGKDKKYILEKVIKDIEGRDRVLKIKFI